MTPNHFSSIVTSKNALHKLHIYICVIICLLCSHSQINSQITTLYLTGDEDRVF